MSDGYIRGLITGVLASMGIVLLSVLIYFVFIHDSLNKFNTSLGYEMTDPSEEYQSFVTKEGVMINIIKDQFYEKVDDESLYRGAFDGIVAALNDPYARYYSPDEFKTVSKTNEGEYVGIGCYTGQSKETKEIIVVAIIAGTPADKGGLQAGDIIIAIDDVDVTGLDLNDAMEYVKGRPGTELVLTVKREGEIIKLPMKRDTIEQKTVESKMLEDKIGYIRVYAFRVNTVEQFKQMLNELEAEGMEKLIVDLRDNPGGVYNDAVDILDVFLEKDVFVSYIEGSNGEQEKSYTKDDDSFDKPTAILIDGDSASAAELFTQTMKEYGKAVIIGTKSYGKGIYQKMYPLGADGSVVKFTAGRYYSPQGVCIHGIGIEPDIVVELEEPGENEPPVNSYEDNQAKAAIEYLKNK